MFFCLYKWYRDHRDIHVLTHPFPTLLSSDLIHFQLIDAEPSRIGKRRHRVFRRVGGTAAMRGNQGRTGHGETGSRADRFGADAARAERAGHRQCRSEEHTSELQSLMRQSYAVFCLNKNQTYTMTTCRI